MPVAYVTDFFKQMGCEGSTNAYSIVGSTPLVDSLFSIKYALYEGKQDNPRLMSWTLPMHFQAKLMRRMSGGIYRM